MSLDIQRLLADWPSEPDGVTARLIVGDDGARQLQLRLDVGILQMQLDGRPDGQRPRNCNSWLDHLEQKTAGNPPEVPNSDDWAELDREMMQFYHRRVALLVTAQQAQRRRRRQRAVSLFRRAVGDADHNLRAMDFIAAHSPHSDYVDGHDRSRAFVLAHRAEALAHLCRLEGDAEQAIEQLKAGASQIEQLHTRHGLEEWIEHDPTLLHLRALERNLRRRHGIDKTLHEQLAEAVAEENYERAAMLRDRIHRRRLTEG
ncbi:MAG TPA: UvrB/UvrC motif-containing protein [Phycisphaerae bacterium]|nr:UvrB/UvrC motif-containing protein [Phycisphaerae bacterium]